MDWALQKWDPRSWLPATGGPTTKFQLPNFTSSNSACQFTLTPSLKSHLHNSQGISVFKNGVTTVKIFQAVLLWISNRFQDVNLEICLTLRDIVRWMRLSRGWAAHRLPCHAPLPVLAELCSGDMKAVERQLIRTYLVLGGPGHKIPVCTSRVICCKSGESWTPQLLEWGPGFLGKQIHSVQILCENSPGIFALEKAKKDPDIPACLPSPAVSSQWLLIVQKRELFRQFSFSLKTHLTNIFVLLQLYISFYNFLRRINLYLLF